MTKQVQHLDALRWPRAVPPVDKWKFMFLGDNLTDVFPTAKKQGRGELYNVSTPRLLRVLESSVFELDRG